jgi:hypothetical protein
MSFDLSLLPIMKLYWKHALLQKSWKNCKVNSIFVWDYGNRMQIEVILALQSQINKIEFENKEGRHKSITFNGKYMYELLESIHINR